MEDLNGISEGIISDEMRKEEQDPVNARTVTKAVKRRALSFAGTLLICFVVFACMFVKTVLDENEKSAVNVKNIIDSIAADLSANGGFDNAITAAYVNAYSAEIDVLQTLLSDDDIQAFTEERVIAAVPYMEKLRSISGCREIFVANSQGDLLLASDETLPGKNLVELGTLTREQLDQLIAEASLSRQEARAGAEDEAAVLRVEGKGCFYAKALTDSKGQPIDAYLIGGYDVDSINAVSAASLVRTLQAETLSCAGSMVRVCLQDLETGKVLFDSGEEGSLEGVSLQMDESKGAKLDEDGGIWVTFVSSETSEKHDAYARQVTISGMDTLILFAFYGINEESLSEQAHLLSAMCICAAGFLILAALFMVYASYASHSMFRLNRYGAMTAGFALLCTIAFGLLTYFAVSLMQLTLSTDSAVKMNAFIEEQTGIIEESTGSVSDYFKELDLNSVELLAYDIEHSGAELIDDNAVPHVYLEGSSSGAYAALTDTFGNDLVCYGGTRLLSDRLDVLDASRIYILNDCGYAIASSDEVNWSYNANQQADVQEIRDVLYGKSLYRYKYIKNENGRSVGIRIDYPITLYAYSENGKTLYTTYENYSRLLEDDQRKKSEDAKEPLKLQGLLSVEIDGQPQAETILSETYDNLYKLVTGSQKAAVAVYGGDGVMTEAHGSELLSEEAVMTLELPEKIGEHIVYNFFRELGNRDCLIHADSYYASDAASNTVSLKTTRCIIMPTDSVFGERTRQSWVYIRMAIAGFAVLGVFLFFMNRGSVAQREQKAVDLIMRKLEETAEEKAQKEEQAAEPEAEKAEPEAEKTDAAELLEEPSWSELLEADERTAEAILHQSSIRSRLKKLDLQRVFTRTDTLAMMLIQIILILAFEIIASGIFQKSVEGTSSLFVNIYGSEWERCFNIYNISASAVIFLEISVVCSFLQRLAEIFFVPLGSRVETYVKLAISVVKYVLIFVGVLFSAYLLGVEIGKITTAATVVGAFLVANSDQIRSDMLTGFTLFTEGSYMIGDRVQVEGFTGTIKEIGLRNCTLVNEQGMIKTVKNSSMLGAIRLTGR